MRMCRSVLHSIFLAPFFRIISPPSSGISKGKWQPPVYLRQIQVLQTYCFEDCPHKIIELRLYNVPVNHFSGPGGHGTYIGAYKSIPEKEHAVSKPVKGSAAGFTFCEGALLFDNL